VFGVLVGLVLLVTTAGHAQRPRVAHLVDDYPGAYSPDGKTIVFVRVYSTSRYGIDPHPVPQRATVFLMDADGTHARAIRHPGARFEGDPTFSPDGRSILFLRNERIYVMRRDGTGARPVRRDRLRQACANFSPAGTKISFWRWLDFPRRGGYFVMNADGTDVRPIRGATDRAPWGCPSWFPGGERLVFAKDYRLWVASLDDMSLRPITRDDNGNLYRPIVSPDGRWIVCDGSPGSVAGDGLVVMRANGTRMRMITSSEDELQSDVVASWSPDGSWIVFAGHRARYEGYGVYVVRPDGTGLRRLTNFRR